MPTAETTRHLDDIAFASAVPPLPAHTSFDSHFAVVWHSSGLTGVQYLCDSFTKLVWHNATSSYTDKRWTKFIGRKGNTKWWRWKCIAKLRTVRYGRNGTSCNDIWRFRYHSKWTALDCLIIGLGCTSFSSVRVFVRYVHIWECEHSSISLRNQRTFCVHIRKQNINHFPKA